MYTRPERAETVRYNMYVATGNVCANIAQAENMVFRPETSAVCVWMVVSSHPYQVRSYIYMCVFFCVWKRFV
jgi:hypothetical protein